MITAYKMDDLAPRRPATLASLDARLSVWGQASRENTGRRAESVVEGGVLYVERVGRNAELLQSRDVDPAIALLGTDYESLVNLATGLLPSAVTRSCRLLWVDPDRLRERFAEALIPAVESARAEIRRLQALYRRRARLWQHDQSRLDKLRIELEAMRVPRCDELAIERVGRGLLARHVAEAADEVAAKRQAGRSVLRVRPGSIARWIAQLDSKIEGAPVSVRG